MADIQYYPAETGPERLEKGSLVAILPAGNIDPPLTHPDSRETYTEYIQFRR